MSLTNCYSIYEAVSVIGLYSRQRPYWCNPSFSRPANSSHPLPTQRVFFKRWTSSSFSSNARFVFASMNHVRTC